VRNKEFISGHWYESQNRYKGDLDYVIPYIISKVKNPEKLVVATNYEETSFMYYLKCKTTIGFLKYNLEADMKIQPDIVIYKKGWDSQNDHEIFLQLLKRAEYVPVYFPVVDYFVNNIPEVSEDKQALRHQFKTLITDKVEDQLEMFVRKEKADSSTDPKYDVKGELK
jgi:hypothetical protein